MEANFDIEMLVLLLGCDRTSELCKTPPQFLSIIFDQPEYNKTPLITWAISKVCEIATEEGLRASSNTTGLPASVISSLLQESSGLAARKEKSFARPVTASKMFSAELKQNVLDFYTATSNVAEAARQFNIQQPQVYLWVQKYLPGTPCKRLKLS